MNCIRSARVDDLHPEFVAPNELLGRIDVTAGIRLIDKPAVPVGAAFDDLAPGHDGLNQLAIAKHPELEKLAFEFHFASSRISENR